MVIFIIIFLVFLAKNVFFLKNCFLISLRTILAVMSIISFVTVICFGPNVNDYCILSVGKWVRFPQVVFDIVFDTLVYFGKTHHIRFQYT